MNFIYQARPARVIFGAVSLDHLEREVLERGTQRALALCTPEQRDLAQRIAERLGARAAGLYDRATMHVPIEIARDAQAFAQSCDADCAIAIGGGSTIGLGKAIALESSLPILAIPTTYAGSEMTPIDGLTEGGRKRTGSDARVLPKTVIYDPALTVTLPVELSVTSGLNAIAHAAEGLYTNNANPVMSLVAEEGIRAHAPDAMQRIARTIGTNDAARGLYALALDNGAPVSLKAIGMQETNLDRAAEGPWPDSAADLERRQLLPEPRAHFRAERLQRIERPDHDLEFDDSPVVVEADHVDPLQRLAADARAELQHHALAVIGDELAVIGEILEDRDHRAQRHQQRGRRPVRLERHRRTEHGVRMDDRFQCAKILAFDHRVPRVERLCDSGLKMQRCVRHRRLLYRRAERKRVGLKSQRVAASVVPW